MNLMQSYSTWGDKLLKHCDVLAEAQHGVVRPINVQIAPTEACGLRCSYCSVANRERGALIPWCDVEHGLYDFASLGAKALEITGGGDPLLYRDGKHDVNDIVYLANHLNLQVGLITNTPRPFERLTSWRQLAWVRVSLSALDAGAKAEDYVFEPKCKVGCSYIVHEGTKAEVVAEVVKVARKSRFLRLAPDCKAKNVAELEVMCQAVASRFGDDEAVFVKSVADNDWPFAGGCYVGLFRPYWTHSGVYICTSHVLATQKYEPGWKMCDIADVVEFWHEAGLKVLTERPPYACDTSKCWRCYYHNNNALLHGVFTPVMDKEFA